MSGVAARRSSVVLTSIVVLLALLLTVTILSGVWVYRDGAWLRDLPEKCWVVTVRTDGTQEMGDRYEAAREMTLRALKALNAEYPGQLEWDYGKSGGGYDWPDYGWSQCVFSRSREGALPTPEVVLQKCLQLLKDAHGPWRVAVRDDQGRLAGPARMTLP